MTLELCALFMILCLTGGDSGFIGGFGGFFSEVPSTTGQPYKGANPGTLGVFNPFGALNHAEQVENVITGVLSKDKNEKENTLVQEESSNVVSGGQKTEEQTSVSETTAAESSTATSASNATVAEPSTKKPPVPVDDEDRRVVVEAPQRGCEGDGTKRDHAGNCREMVR